MGYYNFYRLIREIRYLFSNKKIKKLLTIIAIFIIVILILHNKGYCAQSDSATYRPVYLYSIGNTDGLSFDNKTNTLTEYDSLYVRPVYCAGIKSGFTYNMHNYTSDTIYVLLTNDFPSVGAPVMLFLSVSSNDTASFVNFFGDCYMCVWTSNNSTLGVGDFPISEVENVYGRNYVTSADLYEQIHWLNDNLNTYNQSILDAINDYLYGDESKTDYPISSNIVNDLALSPNGVFLTNSDSLVYYIKVKNGYNYKINYKYSYNSDDSSRAVRIGYSDGVPVANLSGATILQLNNQISYEGSYDYTATSDGYLFVSGLKLKNRLFNVEFISNYNESQELGLSQSIINNNNQNTQTIDNTITNSNVDINENQLVTDNTQDITDDGYDNIFITIKNAFTGSPSAITFPLTFLGNGQNLVLQPDFLSSALSTAGLGVIVNVVGAYWYFVVCRYIVKKIHEIIEGLKEGELEKTTGNIKTEVF